MSKKRKKRLGTQRYFMIPHFKWLFLTNCFKSSGYRFYQPMSQQLLAEWITEWKQLKEWAKKRKKLLKRESNQHTK
jgi:hypothetical protein